MDKDGLGVVEMLVKAQVVLGDLEKPYYWLEWKILLDLENATSADYNRNLQTNRKNSAAAHFLLYTCCEDYGGSEIVMSFG